MPDRACPRCGALLSGAWPTEMCGSCNHGNFQFNTVSIENSLHPEWADGNRAACDFFHRKKLRELTMEDRRRIAILKAEVASHDGFLAMLRANTIITPPLAPAQTAVE